MKMKILALLTALCLLLAATALAEDVQTQSALETTTAYRWFVNQYNNVRGVTVTYYDDVYAINHGKYGLTPFAASVPEEYFVADESGSYAVAPIVLDITDAMRTRLYGGDVGELGLLYGQYCERVRGNGGKVGFSGVHEGIDFIAGRGTQLYAILGGEVTRAGDSNGTVGVYNEEYDVTLLYLHCEQISVRRGDVIEAGAPIALEGKKGSGAAYTHVELRAGRHTSSSAYRNVTVESDCPYPVMQEALGIEASGRSPMTYAVVLEEQRRQAELAEAERQALEATPAPAEALATPDVELVDQLPGTASGYGFGSETPASDPTPAGSSPAATPIPEATLPPAA